MKPFRISRERFEIVHDDISSGSEPALRFYFLVAVSTLIASFGLIADSTAVVIGAMLVAPLMTPIFGMALALVRGEATLLARAIRAEIMGVVSAVIMGFILGSLLGDFDPTPEMLSRTRPNLIDLFVAVLAGLAGAYALVDEKISPALPGVAIATAIVPPLANSGLCLALGETAGGIGSFLLFFANFLSILLAASAVFLLSGMAKRYGAKTRGADYLRRFGVPLIAFVVITAFFSHSLVAIFRERRITNTIRDTLDGEMSQMPASYLGNVRHYAEGEKIHVMASVHAPKILAPTEVTLMQNRLAEAVGQPTELIVHCILSNNVSALGAVSNVVAPRLDGTFVKKSDNPNLNLIAITEQILREYFASDRALKLIRVEFLPLGKRKLVVGHILGVRKLTPEEVALLEIRIREASGDEEVELGITALERTLYNNEEEVLYGWVLGDKGTPEVRERIRQIRADLASAFAGEKDYVLVNVNANRMDDGFHLLLEIVGPEIYPRPKLQALEAQLVEKYKEPIVLYAWSRVETVYGPDGMNSMKTLRRYFNARQRENMPDELPMILETATN